jgi:hypothetical protein
MHYFINLLILQNFDLFGMNLINLIKNLFKAKLNLKVNLVKIKRIN